MVRLWNQYSTLPGVSIIGLQIVKSFSIGSKQITNSWFCIESVVTLSCLNFAIRSEHKDSRPNTNDMHPTNHIDSYAIHIIEALTVETHAVIVQVIVRSLGHEKVVVLRNCEGSVQCHDDGRADSQLNLQRKHTIPWGIMLRSMRFLIFNKAIAFSSVRRNTIHSKLGPF